METTSPHATCTGDEARRRQANGNLVRCAQAQLKKDVRAGRTTIPEILQDTPEVLNNVPLYEVLLWMPWMGQRRLKYLNQNAIGDNINLMVTMGEMRERTRKWLLGELTS